MEASKTSQDLLPFECTPAGAAELIESGARLIDVRQDYEFDAGRLPGAERIGLQELAEKRDGLDSKSPVVFYCRTGARSAMAAEAFSEAGFDVTSLAGGINAWVDEGRGVEPEGGYIAEPGQAAAILEARARAGSR